MLHYLIVNHCCFVAIFVSADEEVVVDCAGSGDEDCSNACNSTSGETPGPRNLAAALVSKCRAARATTPAKPPLYFEDDFVKLPASLPKQCLNQDLNCPDTLDEMLFNVRKIRGNNTPNNMLSLDYYSTTSSNSNTGKKCRTNNYGQFSIFSNNDDAISAAYDEE